MILVIYDKPSENKYLIVNVVKRSSNLSVFPIHGITKIKLQVYFIYFSEKGVFHAPKEVLTNY